MATCEGVRKAARTVEWTWEGSTHLPSSSCLFVFISGTMRFSRHGLGASSPLITKCSAIPEVTLKGSN